MHPTVGFAHGAHTADRLGAAGAIERVERDGWRLDEPWAIAAVSAAYAAVEVKGDGVAAIADHDACSIRAGKLIITPYSTVRTLTRLPLFVTKLTIPSSVPNWPVTLTLSPTTKFFVFM